MYFICYKSHKSPLISDDEIIKILTNAQKNNINNNVTGMLLFFENNFIQFIEGEAAKVKILYSKIVLDKRHNDVKVLSEGKITERFFKNWVMGFRVISEFDLQEMIQMNNIGKFTIDDLLNEAKPHIAMELMKSFYINGELDYQNFWKGK